MQTKYIASVRILVRRTKMENKNFIIAIYVDVYYKEDIDYEKAPYGTLCVYDYRAGDIAVKLTAKEKKALGE